MSGHTPGPWIADVTVNDRGGWEAPTQQVVIGNGKNLVAMYESSYADYPDDETNAANARLIAAAPDLLEACLHLCDNYRGHEAEEHSPLGKARAAIAKATGAAP